MNINLKIQTDDSPSLALEDDSSQLKLDIESKQLLKLSTGPAVYVSPSSDYNKFINKPSIESVELQGDKLFSDLGIFRVDNQGYDMPDSYTLDSMDINTLWENSIPIGG